MTTQSESNLDKQISEVICLQCLSPESGILNSYTRIQGRSLTILWQVRPQNPWLKESPRCLSRTISSVFSPYFKYRRKGSWSTLLPKKHRRHVLRCFLLIPGEEFYWLFCLTFDFLLQLNDYLWIMDYWYDKITLFQLNSRMETKPWLQNAHTGSPGDASGIHYESL